MKTFIDLLLYDEEIHFMLLVLVILIGLFIYSKLFYIDTE